MLFFVSPFCIGKLALGYYPQPSFGKNKTHTLAHLQVYACHNLPVKICSLYRGRFRFAFSFFTSALQPKFCIFISHLDHHSKYVMFSFSLPRSLLKYTGCFLDTHTLSSASCESFVITDMLFSVIQTTAMSAPLGYQEPTTYLWQFCDLDHCESLNPCQHPLCPYGFSPLPVIYLPLLPPFQHDPFSGVKIPCLVVTPSQGLLGSLRRS